MLMAQYEAPLDASHLDGALRLSIAAQWNQNARDWRYMLEAGYGWGLFGSDGELRATTIALPYAGKPAFTWISMVLVLPEYRRDGYATRLLQQAKNAIRDTGSIAQLDATPAGHAVYRRHGFIDGWTFTRWQRAAQPTSARPREAAGHPLPGAEIRALTVRDWPAIATLDRNAFGGDRLALLRSLQSREPALAHVALRGSRMVGFVFGRDGRNAMQIGPLVFEDAAVGRVLLERAVAATSGPVFADAPDVQRPIVDALESLGFSQQRPFTRMVLGPTPVAGNATLVGLVAGPELG
jgi:GNAT superfamily N-acetyltransferase